MNAVRLATYELRRFRGPIRRVALGFLLVVPLLYAGVYLWANWNPYGHLDRIPVAVVDLDQPAQVQGQPLAAGQEFTEQLEAGRQFDWHAVSAEQASSGLKDGTYFFTVTVPQDFSTKLASLGGPTPERAAIDVQLNDGNGYIVGLIASNAERELQAAIDTAVQTMLAETELGGAPNAGSSQDRARDAMVLAGPVDVASTNLHPAGVYGRGVAPFFLSIGLWVFALLVFIVMRPLSNVAVASALRSPTVALGGFLPAAAVGAAAAAIAFVVGQWAVGLDAEKPLLLLALLVLGIWAFTAIAHGLRTSVGPAAQIAMLVVLVLQLSAAGGIYPLEVSPGFFGTLHTVLPMSYTIEGFRYVISGGDTSRFVVDLLVLGGYLAVFLGLSVWSVSRHRQWTMQRLRPQLQL